MKLSFSIERKNPNHARLVDAVCAEIRRICATQDLLIRLSDLLRTLDQNAAMWPALRDFARDVPTDVIDQFGNVTRADANDMKSILTAAFQQETRMARGLYGGYVFLGARTSKFGKQKMRDFLTFVRAEGDQRGVRWSAPARDNFDRYC